MDSKVYVIKKDCSGPMGLDFRKGDEIQIIRNMVYMGGFPVSIQYQEPIKEWVSNNKSQLTQR